MPAFCFNWARLVYRKQFEKIEWLYFSAPLVRLPSYFAMLDVSELAEFHFISFES